MIGFWRVLLVVALCTIPSLAAAEEKCLSCHEGIEMFSEVEGMKQITCVECHNGDGSVADDMEKAHKGMWANPTDFRVVDQTCGTCHPEEVENNMKSLHSTMAGQINGTRYGFGLQGRETLYAVRPVKDDDPQGKFALKELVQVPSYDPSKPEGPTNSPGDDYLRNQCLRCHLWSDGHQRDGDYRASGCAACHVVYSDKGTYEGGDKAIDKAQKDRPRFHRLTVKIPETQCLHCHNRGGRTGVSYIGTIESDGYGTPWTKKGGKQSKLHGKMYNHLKADIHYDKGMTCIDCHTKQDLHGDGNIYAKREQGVEIECEDCHGTMDQASMLKTSWGNEYTNLSKKDGNIILTAKMTGKEHVVPQIKDAKYTSQGYAAMVANKTHMQKLECYSCHAEWAPQCYGCHAKQDIGKPNGDWITPKPGAVDPSMESHKNNRAKTAYSWSESRSYVRWEEPALGINSEGKVSPFIPGCQVIFTQMDGDKNIVNNKAFTTVDGTSGMGHNPIQPHTVRKEARSCSSCHDSTKALGLGGGIYDISGNFPDGDAPVDFELERFVDEEGNQLQQTSRDGARPFNKEEMQRIRRSGTCVACHGVDDALWKKVEQVNGDVEAPNDMVHTQAIEKLLKKAVK